MFTLEDILNRQLINESQESKSISAAKKLVMQKLGYSEPQADDFIRKTLRHDVPILRNSIAAKFILGVTRMVLDKQVNSVKGFDNLNKALKYAATDEYINKFDRNLNGLSAQEFYDEFKERIKADEKAEDEKIAVQDYGNESNGYEIVTINSFEDAQKYHEYTQWCVTHSRDMYNKYTSDDNCTFYFCLRNGYKHEPREVGDGCPLDSYGLSMLAVRVRVDDGAYVGTTCRWNHDHGGSDDVMSKSRLCEIVGVNFEEAFPPNPNAEKGMSYEEYMDAVYEDSEFLISIDGFSYYLSQEREPNVVPQDFESDKKGFEYEIYDDDSNWIGGNYEKNGVVASIDDVGAILKNYHGGFDVLCSDGSSVNIDEDYSKYIIDANSQGIVAISDDGDYLLYCYNGGSVETKHINQKNHEIKNAGFLSDANFVETLHEDGTWSVYRLYNDGAIRMLFTNEEPKGESFAITTTQDGEMVLACRSGHIYDVDGELINGGKGYDTSGELVGVAQDGTKYFKITNMKGECGVASEDESSFITLDGNSWFDEIEKTVISYIVKIGLDGTWTLVNLSIGEQICDFSTNVGFADAKTTDVICAYNGEDKRYKLLNFNGRSIIDGKPWNNAEWAISEVRPLSSPYLYIYGEGIQGNIINLINKKSIFDKNVTIRNFERTQVYNGKCYNIELDGYKHALFDALNGKILGYFDHLFFAGGVMMGKPMGEKTNYLYDDTTLQPIVPIDRLASVGLQRLSDGTPLARCVFHDGSTNFITLKDKGSDYNFTVHDGHWLFKNNIQGVGSGYNNYSDIQFNGKQAKLNLDDGNVSIGGDIIGNVNESAIRFKNQVGGLFKRIDEARKRTFMDRFD